MQAAAAFSFLPFGYSEIFNVVKKVAIRQKKEAGTATSAVRPCHNDAKANRRSPLGVQANMTSVLECMRFVLHN